jgi:hypothetical protein
MKEGISNLAVKFRLRHCGGSGATVLWFLHGYNSTLFSTESKRSLQETEIVNNVTFIFTFSAGRASNSVVYEKSCSFHSFELSSE